MLPVSAAVDCMKLHNRQVMRRRCVRRSVAGGVQQGIKMMTMTCHEDGDLAQARLAAIVSSSTDAIISKRLDGVITSWNAAAVRVFGYEAVEMIGQHITRIIPPERWPEEVEIISRLRKGERVEHFDTVRMRKDGSLIDVSLTISPLHDATGRVVGASKIARDISDRKRAEAVQRMLLEELNHRVKNMLAMVQSIAWQSLRSTREPANFVDSFTGRIQALARVHEMVSASNMGGAALGAMVRDYALCTGPDPRVSIDGPEVGLNAEQAVRLALVLHELCTNAHQHGALSRPEGRLTVDWQVDGGTEPQVVLCWREEGAGATMPLRSGFGGRLIAGTFNSPPEEATTLDFTEQGMVCVIRFPVLQATFGALKDPAF